MNFSSFFVKNPVYAIVLNVMIVIIGVLSVFSLKVRKYPKVDIPQIAVYAHYRNATPSVIESAVVAPLEDELAGIEGINEIRSYASFEHASVNLKFKEGTSMDKAVSLVRDALGKVRSRLPTDVHEPAIYRYSGDCGWLMVLSVESDVMSPLELNHFVRTSIKNVVRGIEGVSTVSVYGESYLTKILLDSKKMHMFGINANDIYKAIDSEKTLRPIGKVQNTVSAALKSKLDTVDDFAHIIIRSKKYKKNSLRHVSFLKDIADIELVNNDQVSECFFNGQKGTIVAIKAASDANPVEVANRVHQRIKELKKEITSDVQVSVIDDSTETVRASIRNAENSVIEAIILVLLIIFLFLKSFKATLIPIVTIPISLIGAIIFLKTFGFSINVMTLLAMVLAVGLVVDDAIVVLENVSRHINNGMSSVQAALEGSKEISMTIVAMTVTLMSVYAPLSFVEGVIGQLFIEFAVALAGSVLISGFVALTLSPYMCSVLLKEPGTGKLAKNREGIKETDNHISRLCQVVMQKIGIVQHNDNNTHKGKSNNRGRNIGDNDVGNNSWFNWLDKLVAKFEFVQIKPTVVMALTIGSLLLSFWIANGLKRETAPSEDCGSISISVPKSIGKDKLYYKRQVAEIAKLLKGVLEVTHYVTWISSEHAYMKVSLVPKNQRKRLAIDIATSLREQIRSSASIDAYVWGNEDNLPGIEGGQGNAYIDVVVSTSDSYTELYKNLEKAQAEFAKNPIFDNPRNKLQLNDPTYNIKINNDKLAKLGLHKEDIARTMEISFSGNRNLSFEKDGIEYPILIETINKPETLSDIYITNDLGKRISLDVIAQMQLVTEPVSFFHYNQMRSAYFGFGVAEGADFDTVLQTGMNILDNVLPKSYKKTVQGAAQQTKTSSNLMLWLFVLALVFIYAVLALLFNNFIDPLIVLFVVPLACSGALFGLWLTNTSMNIYTSVGLITLIGLITKHGIMIVDFTNQLITKGLSVQKAVAEAVRIRFRPILITTGAMFLGSIPLIISYDYGYESRYSIGIVLLFGLAFGTVFVLTIFPNLCLIIKKNVQR